MAITVGWSNPVWGEGLKSAVVTSFILGDTQMWTLRIAMCISAIYDGLVQGKSTGTQLFSYEICGFPVDFPLNQSIDIYIYIYNIYIYIHNIYIYIHTYNIYIYIHSTYNYAHANVIWQNDIKCIHMCKELLIFLLNHKMWHTHTTICICMGVLNNMKQARFGLSLWIMDSVQRQWLTTSTMY